MIMIAHDELHGAAEAAVEAALTRPPLADAATQTIAAFSATSDLLAKIGELTVEYGAGKPLAVFQSLLGTYRALVRTQAALADTARHVLLAAGQQADGS